MHLSPAMSLLPRVLPLPIHAPTGRDIYVCHPDYGREIVPLDCQKAVDTNWLKGTTPIHYYFRDPTPSGVIDLPDNQEYGSCTVALEQAGPDDLYPNYLSLSPNKLRGLAGFLIETCANRNGGIGGFVTVNFENAENYIESLPNNAAESRRNATAGKVTSGAFLTLSIRKPDTLPFRPGDTEPLLAGHLSAYADSLMDQYYGSQPAKSNFFYDITKTLHDRFLDMSRGGYIPWWAMLDPGSGGSADTVQEGEMDDTATSKDNSKEDLSKQGGGGGSQEGGDPQGGANDTDVGDMTYACDSALGGPDPKDCEQLSWSGLKAPDAVEAFKANVPNFYTQGTCAFGVSSPIATTLTWAHILAAFGTLNNLCVQNPIKAVKGGRAFYGQQSVSSWINGKRDVIGERDAVGGVNGSEALPQGINATIFRHDAVADSALKCEWAMAAQGQNVNGCDVG